MDEHLEFAPVGVQNRRGYRYIGCNRVDGKNADCTPISRILERLLELNRKQFRLRLANFRIEVIGDRLPSSG